MTDFEALVRLSCSSLSSGLSSEQSFRVATEILRHIKKSTNHVDEFNNNFIKINKIKEIINKGV